MPGTKSPTLRETLELRFDGPIPPQLLESGGADDLALGHHRALLRFSETRIADFTASLARLEAAPPTQAMAVWIARTRETIAFHQSEAARHRDALRDLSAERLARSAPGH